MDTWNNLLTDLGLPSVEEMKATPGGINAPLDETGDRWLFRYVKALIIRDETPTMEEWTNMEKGQLRLFHQLNADFTVVDSNGDCAFRRALKMNVPTMMSGILISELLSLCEGTPANNQGVTALMTFLQSRIYEDSFEENGVLHRPAFKRFCLYELLKTDLSLVDNTGRNCLWYAWFGYYRVNNKLPATKPTGLLKKLHDKSPGLVNQQNMYAETFLDEVISGFREPDGTRWYPDELKDWRYRLVKQLVGWGAHVTPQMIGNALLLGHKSDAQVARFLRESM